MVVVNGRIKGKDRPKFNTKTGRAYTSKETSTYENWVRINYQEQDGRYLEGAIRATIIVHYEIPKSYTKKRIQAIREGREHPCKKPDG